MRVQSSRFAKRLLIFSKEEPMSLDLFVVGTKEELQDLIGIVVAKCVKAGP